MVSLVHEEVTNQIIASAFEVSNQLGTGFLEKVYENALKVEMKLRGLKVETQKQFPVFYKGNEIGVFQPDLLVNGKVIVEVKSTEKIISVHQAQLLNYLKVTGLKVGLIINFGKAKVEYQRIVL